MWFKKVKKEVSGITLSEWIRENVTDTHCVTIYMNTEKGYRECMHAYGVNEIPIGKLEYFKDNTVEKVITVLDRKSDSIDKYVILLG